ncbi:hypothetical protein [Halobacillus mangrovi]|uniref:Uncharacterized protein n=1 Tax=Halobacillus mangrovi TaxID=402384 RepID=A0A1W5ZY60_9BACI|nr:hypothetical protein [Halobacillus mangrovi]ARI78232.1 hypothetical protein HM131_15845 [Halobacillus mangrovi]
MSEEKMFTQEDVDRIVQERLKRARAKAEREREEAQAELDARLPDYKELYFSELKYLKLLKAGFPMEKAERATKYIHDGTPEEVERQAKELAEHAGHSKQTKTSEKQPKGKWNPF